MGLKRLTRAALVGVVPLLLIACSGAGTGGQGGGPGSGGTTGSGGATGGSGGGAITDGGPDMTALACRNDNDCPSTNFCIPPGTELCPRTCTQVTNPCTADSDCAQDGAIPIVCVEDGCACNSAKSCVRGCRGTADCPLGGFCYSDHHCGLTDCPATCPTDWSCQDLGTGTAVCLEARCTTDSQCSGTCVTGSCYPTLGTCQVQRP